jgi:hypothetical protein
MRPPDLSCFFSLERKIAAPASAVWKVMARPGHLKECHPFCAENLVLRWPGPDACDRVCCYNGRVLERRFTRWQEGRQYTMDVADEKGRVGAEVTFRVRPGGSPAESWFGVVVTLKAFAWLPGPLRRLLWSLKAEPSLRRYFDCVLQGFEYHVTTGKPVRKNQFGLHPEFSSQ